VGVVARDIRLPPLRAGERFVEAYEVVLVMDTREQFMRSLTPEGQQAVQARTQRLQLAVSNAVARAGGAVPCRAESRRLHIGDTLWLARHRRDQREYVLDYLVRSQNPLESDALAQRRRTRDAAVSLLWRGQAGVESHVCRGR
jgi:crossover junction endonuclease MUS81